MLDCILPLWTGIIFDWFNSGIIDDQVVIGIFKYFINKGYCVEVESI